MKGSMCRLYDESLVRNIMVSTGLSILEYIKKNKVVDAEDICDFIEMNADNIIETTVNDINNYAGSEEEEEGGQWADIDEDPGAE